MNINGWESCPNILVFPLGSGNMWTWNLYWVASYTDTTWFYLGHYRSDDKISPLYPRQNFFFRGRLCLVVYKGNGEIAWVSLSIIYNRHTQYTFTLWSHSKKGLVLRLSLDGLIIPKRMGKWRVLSKCWRCVKGMLNRLWG